MEAAPADLVMLSYARQNICPATACRFALSYACSVVMVTAPPWQLLLAPPECCRDRHRVIAGLEAGHHVVEPAAAAFMSCTSESLDGI